MNQISLYKSAQDNLGTTITIDVAIQRIMSDRDRKVTDALRQITDKDKNAAFKAKQFSAVTWSGSFDLHFNLLHITGEGKGQTKKTTKILTYASYEECEAKVKEIKANVKDFDTPLDGRLLIQGRAAELINIYTGILCIDIDKLTPERHDELKALLIQDPYAYFVFTSPNGNGLKILFRSDNSVEDHLWYFEAVRLYFLHKYKETIDVSGKDVSRLCFLPCDPQAHFNPDAMLYGDLKEPAKKKIPKAAKPITDVDPTQSTPRQSFADLETFTNHKSTYKEGNRNNHIFLFACNCARHGYPQAETQSHIIAAFSDFPEGEVPDIVQNAYEHTAGEFGKYAKAPLNKSINLPEDKFDDLFIDCAKFVVKEQQVSTSLIQLKFKLGYNRAGRIIDQLHGAGVIGEYKGSSTREVKIKTLAELDMLFRNLSNPGSSDPVMSSPTTLDPDSDVDSSVLFWTEYTDKARGSKKDVTKVKYSFDNMIAFLANNGFYKYSMKKGSFVLIRVKDNVVETVEDKDIIFFVLDYLESEPLRFALIREVFRQKIGTFMDMKQLVQLPFLPYTIRKLDTATTAYVYFNNTYLRIDKDSVQTRSYRDLEGHIWGRQRIDCDYTDPGEDPSVIADFFLCAICGRQVTEARPLTDIEKKKTLAVWTSIGYMLHRYKNPTLTKAVIATDLQLRDGNDSNGGTGKSLMGKILAKFLNVCNIEGKSFKFDAPRPFETLKPDHSMINFNDVRKNFDFEGLYGLLTDDFTYAVIYKEPVTLSFDDSPKVFISTNYSIKGSGNSMIRRQQVIEFSNYFTPDHQPSNEFGHMFFYDWSKPEHEKEWALYYKFMITCLQTYLRHGLVEFPLENYRTNSFIDTAGEDVLDWCEVNLPPMIGDGRQNKHQLWAKFQADLPHKKVNHINTFSTWIKKYCTTARIAINAHLEGDKRDKSNGAEFWSFTSIDQ